MPESRLASQLAAALRRERGTRLLTQQALAELAGTSQAAVARVERGDRIDDLGLDRLLDRLGDVPHLLAGSTAALLQGAPVPVDAVEIALRWRDSARFTAWLEAAYGQRWNARWEEFGGLRLEPEEPGEHRWRTRYGEIRAQLCDELPESIEVRHGDRSYRVVPLLQVELTDPRAADLLRRHRQRHADGAAADRSRQPDGAAADRSRQPDGAAADRPRDGQATHRAEGAGSAR